MTPKYKVYEDVKTDTHGYNFEPVVIRTSSIHSRIEGKRCIEGCMACHGEAVVMQSGVGLQCKDYPKCIKPSWRSMPNADYDEFLEWVDTNTLKLRYGDPLDKIMMKAFDALFDLWMAKRSL